MRGTVHQFLKWLPAAVCGGAVAVSAVWEAARVWVGSNVQWFWAMMADPWFGAAVLAGGATYAAAILWTAPSAEKTKFTGKIDGFVHGGQRADHPGQRTLLINLTIRNIGTKPSAAPLDGWKVILRDENRETEIGMIAIPGTITAQMDNGVQLQFTSEEAIYNKLLKPLEAGGLAMGYIFCVLSDEQYLALTRGNEIAVVMTDIHDRRTMMRYTWTGKGERNAYLPHAKVPDHG